MDYFDYLPNLSNQEKIDLFRGDDNESLALQKYMKLSKYKLTLLEHIKLGKQVDKISDYISKSPKFINIHLGVVGNYTMNHLKYHMIAAAFRRGILLDVEFSLYDSLYQIALGENQSFETKFDYLLIYSSQEKYYEANTSVELIEQELKLILQKIHTKYHAKIILANNTQRFYDNTSSINPMSDDSYDIFKEQYNLLCKKIVKGDNSTILLDLDKISNLVGIQNWISPVDFYRSKMPFAYANADIFSDYLARLLAAHLGIRKKVVALDLDGVLWGGVLGDNKINDIVIGSGSSEGEAFEAFQNFLLKQLYMSGIVLTVVSKNSLESVIEVFDTCSDMVLKQDQFAMLQVNWKDKASNIKAIAKALNIGLDSFVFLDDNAYERELVRQKLSDVTVLELGNNPADYTRLLANSGYFSYYALSDEDLSRVQSYRNRVQSIDVQKNFSDYNGYLKSLNMRLSMCTFQSNNITRLVQLINKTNQFNLMCTRVNIQDVEQIFSQENIIGFQVSLQDKLENYGVISIVICEVKESILYINTWVMSCRVFNRTIEEAIINYLYKYAKQFKLSKIVGKCMNEKEGNYVDNLYLKRGFHYIGTDNNVKSYELDIKTFKEIECAIAEIIFIHS